MPETKQRKSTSTQSHSETTTAFPLLGTDMAIRMGQTVIYGLLEYQLEMSRFLIQRLEEGTHFQRQLMGFRDPAEAFEALSEFTQTAVRDYTDQIARMQQVAVEDGSRFCNTPVAINGMPYQAGSRILGDMNGKASQQDE